MDGNGQPPKDPDSDVLRWAGRVLTADDLRRSLNGHREIMLPARSVITPLAEEQLRTNGILVRRQEVEARPQPKVRWGYAQDRPHPAIPTVVQALGREGLVFKALAGSGDTSPCRWARALAESVGRGDCAGGVVFCRDPGLVCCVGNKVSGLRAVAVATVAQAARATLTLGANLLAVEMPGRTFFELRQILRILAAAPGPVCPAGVACTLSELDGHAHR
jgi:hypothetical protein